MNKLVYNPGCALMVYKEHLADKALAYLKTNDSSIEFHKRCCHQEPLVDRETVIINTCAGCDKRFKEEHDTNTITLWQMLQKYDNFDYPDHTGLVVSIHDACPIRAKSEVHDSIRFLLKKMNIEVIECEHNRSNSICCGDSLYPAASKEVAYAHMKKRADSMPADNVVVYCVSCIKSIYNGGKKPLHLIDLLFNETTEPQETDIEKWGQQVEDYIATL